MVNPRAAISRLTERRRRHLLQHHVGARPPSTPSVLVADKAPHADDTAIAERLLAAYRAARASDERSGETERADLWSAIYREQGRFTAILDRGDPAELAAYLCNAPRHDATHGIVQGDKEFERIRSDRSYRSFVALMTRDKVVSLAEALGVVPVENPEQGAFGESVRSDLDELLDRIAERIGIAIAPPDIDGGLLKLRTTSGLFGERDLNAIFTAHLLRSILDGQQEPAICEIGGGSGRVAYWSHRLGPTSYAIVDLPHVNVVQGYYLLKSLPAARITLFGETAATAGEGDIRVLPDHAISSLDSGRYDLVLNQDSFPEMSQATVRDYLSWISQSCRGQLISINHESKPPYGDGMLHTSVPETVREVGGFRLRQRFPYWLRRGYVVESYRVTG